jgi:cell division protein FtsW
MSNMATTNKTKTSKTSSRKTASADPPKGYDLGLMAVVFTLLALGLVMVFSASYAQGIIGFSDPYYFISRQLIWTAIGIVTLFVSMRINYRFWERLSIPLMGVAIIALMGVIAFGANTFGSTRTFFGGSIQPSEPAKIAIIIYISAWLASKGRRIEDMKVGLLPFSILMGAVTVMIVIQPDISTALIIVTTASIMFFIAGAKLRQLAIIILGGTATFALVIQYTTYAQGRIERYLVSIRNPLESAEWQSVQSVRAIIQGGATGVGIGNGTAKFPGYLPVSWSDNIFAIIGEEMGLLGALFVILLFAVLAYRGLRIALDAPDNFGMLLATGITTFLVLQAILNAAVVTAVAPPTGVTLPFISYGGSSLVTALGAIGILLNISRYGQPGVVRSDAMGNLSYANFNFGWRNRRSRLSGNRRRRTTRTSTGKKKQTRSAKSGSAKSSRSRSSKSAASSSARKRTGAGYR